MSEYPMSSHSDDCPHCYATMGSRVGAGAKAVHGEAPPFTRPRHGLTAATGPARMTGTEWRGHPLHDYIRSNDQLASANCENSYGHVARYDYGQRIADYTGSDMDSPEPNTGYPLR
jgi:hypothetical protein